ncbi:MAG: VF530 family DNA-binding protein, partial [Fimbriimonadaceae bacterium]|nr:VF530 family DNA-binding protein [Fimbriimonadaceae bacterium]MBX3649486.1 VF530 family DNA-binding protein [Rhodocyclaceae bacterium]
MVHAIHHHSMTIAHPRDPLHGITLETIVTTLVE